MAQYAIFAMIIAVAIQLVDKSHVFQIKYVIVIVTSFVLFLFTKIHPAFIIMSAGVLGTMLG
jgi:chromate transport protein ChrA